MYSMEKNGPFDCNYIISLLSFMQACVSSSFLLWSVEMEQVLKLFYT